MQNLHLQGENALNSNTVADISAKTNSSLANQTRREFLSKGVKMAGAFGALSLGINSAFAAEKKTNSNKGAKMSVRTQNGVNFIKVGNTDIEISQICIGAMSFGKAGTLHDWTLNESDSEAIIKHALDKGLNFFDTANIYSAGTSEEYLGKH